MRVDPAAVALMVSSAAALLAGCHEEPAWEPALARASGEAYVQTEKPRAAVDLGYLLSGTPAEGEELRMELTITPRAPMDRLVVSISASEGLLLVDPAPGLQLESPPRDRPIIHRFTLVPQGEGRFYVNALIATEGAAGPLSRTISIPVDVGRADREGQRQVDGVKTITPEGEAIISLPAEERQY